MKLKTQTRNKPNPNGHYIYITELGRVRAGFWKKKKKPGHDSDPLQGFFFFFFKPKPDPIFYQAGIQPIRIGYPAGRAKIAILSEYKTKLS